MLLREKAINNFKKPLYQVIRILNGLGMAVLMTMVLLLVADVILRRIFNSPLSWGFEIVKVQLAIVVSFTIVYCATQGGHISIDLLTSRFSPKAQKVLDVVIYLFGTALFIFMAWGLIGHAMHLWDAHRITGVLPVPIFYFVFALAFGSMLLALVLLVQLISTVVGMESE